MHQVVITGVGIVSSLGTGVSEFGERMFAGGSGVTEIRGKRVAENFPVPVGGPVARGPLPQPQVLQHRAPEDTPHFWRLAGLATEEAVQHLPEGLPVDGIIYGGHGSIAFSITTGSFRTFEPNIFDWDAFQPESPLTLMREIAERRGHGPIDERNIVSLNNACVTSNQAIGVAFQRVRSGQDEPRAYRSSLWPLGRQRAHELSHAGYAHYREGACCEAEPAILQRPFRLCAW